MIGFCISHAKTRFSYLSVQCKSFLLFQSSGFPNGKIIKDGQPSLMILPFPARINPSLGETVKTRAALAHNSVKDTKKVIDIGALIDDCLAKEIKVWHKVQSV